MNLSSLDLKNSAIIKVDENKKNYNHVIKNINKFIENKKWQNSIMVYII